MSTFVRNIGKLLASMRWRELRVGWWRCPCCHWRLQFRLRATDYGVRCGRCGASAITQSMVAALQQKVAEPATLRCLELSGRGALVDWLERHAGQLTRTEYMPDKPPGGMHGGVRNEDVQAMTFADGSFDLCTSTEVFEHVADDAAGFQEVRRVLAPGGAFVFTVPLTRRARTIERARLEHGRVVHRLEPEYHADPYSGSDKILAFRNYGRDITERLRHAGFAQAEILDPRNAMFGHGRRVIAARKAR